MKREAGGHGETWIQSGSTLDEGFEDMEFWVADRAKIVEECSQFDK